MKIKSIILLITLSLVLNSCGQGKIETPKNTVDKFAKFQNKPKFIEDNKSLYPGIGNPKLLPLLSSKINQACEDFKNVSLKDKPTDKDYQEKIKIGLERFSDLYLELDTEDRERICNYFEELMDIVGLESSGGYLNDFMYGFDPTEIIKKE